MLGVKFAVESKLSDVWLNPLPVCRQSISDSWLGNLREYLAHLV
jgi:hypothetical protein